MQSLTADLLRCATRELSKLPMLGPVLWLFARDPQRRYTFMSDMDWRLLPPLVNDQCKLTERHGMPWGFCTWAYVSDEVDERLRSRAPLIAPHEWRSGTRAWLVDVVAPFGDAESLARDAIEHFAPQRSVRAWMPDASGRTVLRQFVPQSRPRGDAAP